ncbi:MAG: S46 family peptidase [Polyangiaceae bacterium]
MIVSSRTCAGALVTILFAACSSGGSNEGATTPPGGHSAAQSASASASSATTPVADRSVPPVKFENPGGMWLPEQLALQADRLKTAGFTIDASALTKPTEFPLGAVVSLGGCSASFVSADGLIITNHHCVTGALQRNSTPTENLIKDGFLAKDRAAERSAGPAGRALVTRSITDVTAQVRDGIAGARDDLARNQLVEDHTKSLVADCEKAHKNVRCSVASFYNGAEFRLIEQLEIRDLRLVYAPPASIGNYGGEVDNWRWPRHTGDFSFYRAYVGPDGQPADFDAANVPYRPEHVLRLAKRPLRAGDPVLVAGYPARTSRLTTVAETREAVNDDLPYQLGFFEEYLAELTKATKGNKELEIKAETVSRGLANYLTNTKGQLEGLVKGGALQRKADEEAALSKWIDADPARKDKYKNAIDGVARVFADSRSSLQADRSLNELTRMVRLFGVAHTIVRNAEERAKPDAQRDPDYQDRNQRQKEQGFIQLSSQYDAAIDTAMLMTVIHRELRLPASQRAGIADAVLGKKGAQPSDDELRAAIDKLYAETKLGDQAVRVELLKTATVAELKKSKDPLVRLALTLRARTKDLDERGKKLAGAMLVAQPSFTGAMREHAGGLLAPDANRTLRVTFGTVRGYAPKPESPVYFPFTTLSEVVAKNTGVEPFDAPKALLDAFSARRFGAYTDEKLLEVPVDFLADLDITGGNSGSATLNGDGELVGLAFDGNYESMAQAWLFIPELTRSIHVDLRYVLWVLDSVAGADNLLRELGVEPSARR